MNNSIDITIVAAIALNNVIGCDGKLPWHIKEDLIRFKALTEGCSCIFGARTYLSLPKRPLPNRENIVISNLTTDIVGAKVVSEFTEGLDLCRRAGYKIFVCGGSAIYKLALPYATHMELTRVNQSPVGDTFFPPVNWESWQLIREELHDEFSFLSYMRK